MKTKLLTVTATVLLAAATLARAQTNDLTAALQKGLFQEEAAQDLNAAVQTYQGVADQFDKDRKLAATAVFRLGECYRKLGRTNEALAQYERIVREFSDQTTLANLSQQNLAGMGVSQTAAARAASGSTPTSASAASAEASLLANELAAIEKLKSSPEEQARSVMAVFPDEQLRKMLQNLQALQDQEARIKADPGLPLGSIYAGIEYVSGRAGQYYEGTNFLADAQKRTSLQLSEIDKAVRLTIDVQKARLKVLLAAAGPQTTPESTAGASSPEDQEDSEIRRIQDLLQNSPDLINAPDAGGVTLLQKAAAKGELAVVKMLLEHGADVNGAKAFSITPLDYAAANGHQTVVELLLSKGAKVDARTQKGLTALHLAAVKGYELVAKTLIEAGAPMDARLTASSDQNNDYINYKVQGGRTPLDVAVEGAISGIGAGQGGYPGVVKLMLAHHANVNGADDQGDTPLFEAIYRQEPDMVKLLLASGAEANLADKKGQTALAVAAINKDPASVKVLLDDHADPNAGRDLSLGEAAWNGDVETLKLLLAAGANPNAKGTVARNVGRFSEGSHPWAPLFLAASQRHPEAVKLLAEARADMRGADEQNVAMMFWALSDPPTLQALLEAGADPNQWIENGNQYWGVEAPGQSLLQRAIIDGNQADVEVLLAHGAAVNTPDKSGETPLCTAVRLGLNTNIVALLLKSGADVNAKDNKGNTALHLAASSDRGEIAKLLLENKADPNVRNEGGDTPLDIVKRQAGESTSFAANLARITAQQTAPQRIASLLREHGALDNLPHLNRIELSRPSANFSEVIFRKGSNNWNHFTLLELIAVQYRFLNGDPQGRRPSRFVGPSGWSRGMYFSGFHPRVPGEGFADVNGVLPTTLPFPDLQHLRLHHAGADLKSWKDETVDLSPLLSSGDCSRDIPLEWGDVIEVPEADHTLNADWQGFSDSELDNLRKCLARQIHVTIKGQTTTLSLAPEISSPPNGMGQDQITPFTPFWLKPALLRSQLLLASSDLSHVKVTRHSASTNLQWVLDCSHAANAPDFWLRDGDTIEVPEKQ